ncbi:MAG: trigger factor family protein [Candidatus Babeliaceae bacterium]|nr:trigger factor family protein [Candidatus Babeliaceae bacterium]
MVSQETSVYFSLSQQPESPHQLLLHIQIPSEPVTIMYHQALSSIKRDIHTHGFVKGATPESYIATTYKPLLIEHLKQFFFRHCVNAMLQKGIAEHKIITLCAPQPRQALIDPEKPAQFTFFVSTSPNPIKNEWKKLHFKAPGRKNYKDLDRQVDFFLKEEERKQKESKKTAQTGEPFAAETIAFHDWICLSIRLVNQEKKYLLNQLEQRVWVKIGEEEADLQSQELFLGKKVGDSFITNNDFFQDAVSDDFSTHYLFEVTILFHIPSHFFDIDRFKTYFRLKTAKETHQKLIEVFSFRHDISQRRETVEKLFKLLFHHYPLQIDSDIIQQQEKVVLARVQENPDYHVYKNQHDFKEKVSLLAEKQIKEILFIDSIAYQENIQATDEDMINYLHLFKRPRTKEFVYFDIPHSRLNDQEISLCHEEIRRSCQREKTLNYVLYYLTKKS